LARNVGLDFENHQQLFAPFRLDPANEQLWCGDTEVRLRRKTFEALRYLLENPAQLVTRVRFSIHPPLFHDRVLLPLLKEVMRDKQSLEE
jgi:hypothetical protein